MTYRYRLWCPSCTAENDPLGCFGGRVETDEETFVTPQDANNAGWLATRTTIWNYEVIDLEGQVIEVEDEMWMV